MTPSEIRQFCDLLHSMMLENADTVRIERGFIVPQGVQPDGKLRDAVEAGVPTVTVLFGTRQPAGSPVKAAVSAQLTNRQLDVLVELMNGGSEKQIAARLKISPGTVHTYVKQLYKRLNVESRSELMAKIQRLAANKFSVTGWE